MTARGTASPLTQGADSRETASSSGCLNPWDVQHSHIYLPTGISEPLCAEEKTWGGLSPIVLLAKHSAASQGADGRKLVAGSEGREHRCVWCLQGNGIDRADTAGCNGRGWRDDVSYTINTIDRPAVVYRTGRDETA